MPRYPAPPPPTHIRSARPNQKHFRLEAFSIYQSRSLMEHRPICKISHTKHGQIAAPTSGRKLWAIGEILNVRILKANQRKLETNNALPLPKKNIGRHWAPLGDISPPLAAQREAPGPDRLTPRKSAMSGSRTRRRRDQRPEKPGQILQVSKNETLAFIGETVKERKAIEVRLKSCPSEKSNKSWIKKLSTQSKRHP